MEPLSKKLKDFLGLPSDYTDKQIDKWCKDRLKRVCKPCWELKYCPYGPLVEDFPLPPLLRKIHKEHNEYLKNCLETGLIGEGENKTILPDDRRAFFQKAIDEEEPDYLVDKISDFETQASCREFGHLCPAFFVSEPFTETKETRKMTRNIANSTLIRVARRDNNTCQVCGKILLDRDIEIDHIIPFSKGGVSEEHNLRVTCFDCNRNKGDKLDFLHE